MTQQNRTEATPEKAANVVDLNDPKTLLSLLAKMFESQAESTAINRRLLEIELGKKEAQEKKDAEALAKLERARKLSLNELKRKKENDEKRWKECQHVDQKGGSTIWPIGNMPDMQLRGVCSQCICPIEPAHYEYDCNGKKTLVPEHPLYKTVVLRDRQIYAGFVPMVSY
jgi:hypothetical protein